MYTAELQIHKHNKGAANCVKFLYSNTELIMRILGTLSVRGWGLHAQHVRASNVAHYLSSLALNHLLIPASNADSERVLSLVRRFKTDFRASLFTEMLSALIGCHLNKTFECCEGRIFAFEQKLMFVP